HPDTLASLYGLINLLFALERYEEAENLARSTLETTREVLGAEHPKNFLGSYQLADILKARGRKDEAEKLYLYSLETARRFPDFSGLSGITPEMIEAQLKALHTSAVN